MKSQSIISSGTPLLEEAYSFDVVEHPFPLNCCIREWYLGEDSYQAVKIGIVQYVRAFLVECEPLKKFLFLSPFFLVSMFEVLFV